MATPIVAPGGANTPVDSVTTEDGPTRHQHGLAFERIASEADRLNRLLEKLQAEAGAHNDTTVLDAAQAMAEHIGAIADRFAPYPLRHSDEWTFGAGFVRAAREIAA